MHQAVTNVAYEKRLGDVKTETGRRMVDLDERTVEVLRAWRESQQAEHQITGRRWTPDAFVFGRPDGEPIHPDYVSQCFDRHLAKSSLLRIRLHDLRHGAATILLRAGHDLKVVQETLGLSSITIASDTYTSVLPDLARQSAEDAAALLLETRTRRRRDSSAFAQIASRTQKPPSTDAP